MQAALLKGLRFLLFGHFVQPYRALAPALSGTMLPPYQAPPPALSGT